MAKKTDIALVLGAVGGFDQVKEEGPDAPGIKALGEIDLPAVEPPEVAA